MKEKVKALGYWTRKDFESLPLREWNEDIGIFNSLIILPTRKIHDSGYACMDFIAVKDNVPFCRLSGCSDVIHFDGIGGYGEWKGDIPKLVPPKGWCIDCLRTSKLLRIFSDGNIKAGTALSSFEIYSKT